MRLTSIYQEAARVLYQRGRSDQDEATRVGEKPNGAATECAKCRQHEEDERPDQKFEQPSPAPTPLKAPMLLEIVLPNDVVAVLFPNIYIARALDCREHFPQAEESSLHTGHVRIDSFCMIYKTWHSALQPIAGGHLFEDQGHERGQDERLPCRDGAYYRSAMEAQSH